MCNVENHQLQGSAEVLFPLEFCLEFELEFELEFDLDFSLEFYLEFQVENQLEFCLELDSDNHEQLVFHFFFFYILKMNLSHDY